MTTALIQLSKASLSSEKFISIEQELELTDEYLKIQRLRYGAIFEVNKEVDEILMNCLIPRFSIQPAVENALFHGILPKGSGIITIKIYSQEEEIIIEIIDNGIGLSKGQLRIINEELEMATFIGGAKEEISKLKNIGLENINYRIRMHYGKKEGGVRLYEENPGLKVKIIIPQKIYKI